VGGLTPSKLVRGLESVTSVLEASVTLLQQVASCLRELVRVVGWLALLVSAVGLLIHPHLSPAYLAVPGAGALAVLQGAINPRHRSSVDDLIASEAPESPSPVPPARTKFRDSGRRAKSRRGRSRRRHR
jgi:hypothetical protein